MTVRDFCKKLQGDPIASICRLGATLEKIGNNSDKEVTVEFTKYIDPDASSSPGSFRAYVAQWKISGWLPEGVGEIPWQGSQIRIREGKDGFTICYYS